MKNNKVLGFIRRYPQMIILLVFVVVFSILLPQTFPTWTNTLNILKASTTLLILACGMTFAVITGNLDLSMGASLTICLAVALRLQNTNHIFAAFLAPFIIALAIGGILGFIIGRFEGHSVIATLGMMTILNGITYVYTKGTIARGLEGTSYSFINNTNILGIPLYILLTFAFVGVYAILLSGTNFGRSLYYIGVNKEAAKSTGINHSRVMMRTYLFSGLAVAIAATILGSRLLVATPATGTGYEFDALTAILVGGVSLMGGKGKILNTFLGVFIVMVVINGLTQLNMPYEYQKVVKGIMVMISILTEAGVGRKYE